jgi:uncharacterized BrkB/YihY/UPF0761 family membrane protein
MVYLKSFLVGVAAVIVVGVLFLVAIFVYLNVAYKPAEGEAIGWDPISLVHQSPWVTVVLVLVFLVGFFWEFRRARPK